MNANEWPKAQGRIWGHSTNIQPPVTPCSLVYAIIYKELLLVQIINIQQELKPVYIFECQSSKGYFLLLRNIKDKFQIKTVLPSG